MKLSFLSLVSLANFIVVHGETIKCTVVPFETKDGISGTCCVFFNNATSALPQEEVTRQIKASNKTDGVKVKNEETRQNVTKEGEVRKSDDKFQFTEGPKRRGEEEKFVRKSNVTIETKNAFDVASGCPEGQLKDHNGGCTEPFK